MGGENKREVRAQVQPAEVEADFLGLCRLSSPLVKRIPKKVLSLFAKTWADALSEAVHTGLASAWWRFFALPRLVLLPQSRSGSRVSAAKRSVVLLIQRRLELWHLPAERMLQECQRRTS